MSNDWNHLEMMELLELYETTHIVEKNLRGNVAIPEPCIGLLKGRSQTLTPSFFFCLRAVSVLLRFSSEHCCYCYVTASPSLFFLVGSSIACREVLSWRCLGFHEGWWAYLGFLLPRRFLVQTLDCNFLLHRECWGIPWDSVVYVLCSWSFPPFL